jgi:hypothetical protein
MAFSTDKSCGRRPATSPQFRALLWLASLVLVLQLIGSGFHKHDLAKVRSDCVSCQIGSHFPADVPAVNLALQAVFLVVVFLLARLPQFFHVAVPRHLFPPRQAPPRRLFPAL